MSAVGIGGMGAAAMEIWLARRAHPRRHVYAWVAWTPLAAAFLAAGFNSSGAPPGLTTVLTFLLAPLIYPTAAVLFRLHLRLNPTPTQLHWEDVQRAKYRPTDFGAGSTVRAAENALENPKEDKPD